MSDDLKSKTVNALLWSTIDKAFVQISYAVTGVILANILSPEDFGVIGIILVFVAFANIFIDSGFTVALVQKKVTTNKDYSTVFYFNLFVCLFIYLLLYLSAPFIADYYEEPQLIRLTRVVGLQIIFISLGLVQTGILMKAMNIKKLALANLISLTLSAVLAIYLAFAGFGIWALVVQTLSISCGKTLLLWMLNKWRPQLVFSFQSLKETFPVGSGMLMTSFISTFFQNIYTLIIGRCYTIKELGYYTQAEKWSKMGITAFSQTIGNATFPALSSIQDDKERMNRVFGKISRMTAYVTFPAFIGLIIIAPPLFHILFGEKWDASVLLFQLFLIRGIFFILTTLLNNYLMAIGKTRLIFRIEVVKNILILIAIFVTVELGITGLVIGQVIVGVIHYLITLYFVERNTGYKMIWQLKDIVPYVGITCVMTVSLLLVSRWIVNDYLMLLFQIVIGLSIYLLINHMANSKIQKELFRIVSGKRRK